MVNLRVMNVAVLGNGTVGSALVEILKKNSNKSISYCGSLVRRKTENRSDLFFDIDEIISDKGIDTVCECIGGTTDAYEYVKKAILSGKNVVTANKALIAEKAQELMELCNNNNTRLLFSAACGGGMPVLDNLRKIRETDNFISAYGILNGTCNFILTEMENNGTDFKSALGVAQSLGYAEKDPTSDISGLDTLRKIQLIGLVGFGLLFKSNLCCEGIDSISSEIINELNEEGKGVRLLGNIGKNYAYVMPKVVDKNSVLFNIKQNFNYVSLNSENLGTLSLSGMGAGGYPTASNIYRDLITLSDGITFNMLKEIRLAEPNNNILRDFRIYGKKTEIIKKTSLKDVFEDVEKRRKKGEVLFLCEV